MAAGRTWALYIGGFLGPFGGGITTTMMPEMAHGVHASVTGVGLAITAYMVPFALVMLLSGSLAERWGRGRTLRAAYLVYVAASLAVAAAPRLDVVLAARAVQGAANAFTTPVLIAVLSGRASDERLGRTLGVFGAFQAAGQAFSPFVGGVAASVGWRWGFVASAVAAVVLVVVTPTSDGDRRGRAVPRMRSVLRPGVLVGAVAAAFAYLTSMGLTVLGALMATDAFGAGPSLRGLVVACFGAAGLAAGRAAGRLLDAVGIRWAGALLGLAMAVSAAVGGFAPFLVVLAAGLLVGGAANTGMRATTAMLAIRTAPDNAGGAASFVLAFQFIGGAVAPAVLLPIYHAHGSIVLALSGAGAVVGATLLAFSPRPTRAVRPSPPPSTRVE